MGVVYGGANGWGFANLKCNCHSERSEEPGMAASEFWLIFRAKLRLQVPEILHFVQGDNYLLIWYSSYYCLSRGPY